MTKRLLTGFALFAFSMLGAESYHITLPQSTLLQGSGLSAGDYRLDLQDGRAVMTHGKQKIEVPVRIESAAQKYASTNVVFTHENGKLAIREIQLRGTTTKLLFDSDAHPAAGN